MPVQIDSPRHAALDLISDDRMHRQFTLPASATHDGLTVSYADVGRLPEDPVPGSVADHPTVLFMPGMFASRYVGANMHTIAEKLGVRVLAVDRPGMGRSTDVPLEQRISVWVELVPCLLQHLGIPSVSLVSHSAGTIFLLNTLHYCRNVLHPDRPFVGLLAPWVDPSRSKVTLMQAARLIPASAFGVWHLLPKLSLLQAKPAFESSGTFFARFSNVLSGSSPLEGEQDPNCSRLEADYGLPRRVQSELQNLLFKSMFAENTVGANSEALLCLKKGPNATWGHCQDYEAFAKWLYSSEEEKLTNADSDHMRTVLKVRAYFAESDALVGKKGQEYFSNCFSGEIDGVASNAVDFEASTIAGTDHDTVIGAVGVLEEIFCQAGGHLSSSTE